MSSLQRLVAVVALFALLASCGGGPAGVAVQVTPTEVQLGPGETVVLQATVTRGSSDAVVWSATGGTIEGSGRAVTYTAPEHLGEYVVTATSVADPSSKASATIVVGVHYVVLPDQDAFIEVNAGQVHLAIPAGAVEEPRVLRMRAIDAVDLPDGFGGPLVAVEVDGVGDLKHPAWLSFSLPEGGESSGQVFHVLRRPSPADDWVPVYSWYEDGRISTLTTRFSGFSVASGSLSTETSVVDAPGYSAEAYGIHFGNDARTVAEMLQDHGWSSGVLDVRYSGVCFGFAATSYDHYRVGRKPAVGREVGNDAFFGEAGHLPGKSYHSNELANYVIARHVDQLGHIIASWLDDAKLLFGDLNRHNLSQVDRIVSELRTTREPVVLGYSFTDHAGRSKRHVVVVFHAAVSYSKESDTLTYVMKVYDPNNYGLTATAPRVHEHLPVNMTVTVQDFERDRLSGSSPQLLLAFNWPDSPWNIYRSVDRLHPFALRGRNPTPWSNPILYDVGLVQVAGVVRLTPLWSHPNTDAVVERAVWKIDRDGGENAVYEFSPLGLGVSTHEVDLLRLGPGDYVVRSMVQDAQQNWSNVVEVPLVVAAPPAADGVLAVVVDGLPVGQPADVTVIGQDTIDRPVTSSTSLAVPPGDYLILARTVVSSSATFVPTPSSQMRTVESGGSVTATVAYAQAAPPAISTFSAAPSTIAVGSSSTLSWQVGGSEPITLSIDRGVGNVTGRSSADVFPAETTTYTLTATNPYGSTTREVSVTVQPYAGSGPVAHLSSSPRDQVAVNATVTLDAGASTFGDGLKRLYHFDSGDDRHRSSQWGTWSLSYPAVGVYSPCVVVENTLGERSSPRCITLSVHAASGTGPDLIIPIDGYRRVDTGWIGPPGFTEAVLLHGDGMDLRVDWYNQYHSTDPLPPNHAAFRLEVWADGQSIGGVQYAAGSQPPAGSRVFGSLGASLEPGTYTISMIIDATNAITERDKTNNLRTFRLTVQSLEPTADFSFSSECLTTSFVDTSSHPRGDHNIDQRTWDFRDGNTSTQPNPTHSYDAPGSYNVRLTVRDVWGNTDSRTRRVEVEECEPVSTPPTITSFTSDPPAIVAGESSTLRWIVTGTEPVNISISPGIGDVTGQSSTNVIPGETTTFTLTATNSAGAATATSTVTVQAAPDVTVGIHPTDAILVPGGTQSFMATVSGASDTTVTWGVTCGSISGSGNTAWYTAPGAAGSCLVSATSNANPSKSATANVTVEDGGSSFEPAPSYISISNVSLGAASGGSRRVSFDISWDESWRGPDRPSWVAAPDNWDAAWVFVKYRVDGGPWQHATLSGVGHVVPSGAVVDVPNDRVGAFIYRSGSGYGAFAADGVGLQWDSAADGVSADASVEVRPFGIEMVYVPEGSFSAGSGGTNTGEFRAGGTLNTPFVISSQSPITLGDGVGLLMWTEDWYPSGSPLGSTSASFPTGFDAFYVMKYQVTQGQYVDFLNTLTQAQADARKHTGSEHRYAITGDRVGSYATSLPFVPVNYVSWADGAAFADWAGMRPLTELEFEKVARGPLAPVASESAWGSTSLTQVTGLAHAGTIAETPTPAGANVQYGHFVGSLQGPVRVGSFAAPGRSRRDAGAGYYGALELTGNLYEQPVTVGNADGQAFLGTHGDGTLDAIGRATVSSWPPANAAGAGRRGSSWSSHDFNLPVSRRGVAAFGSPDRDSVNGWRGARSAP